MSKWEWIRAVLLAAALLLGGAACRADNPGLSTPEPPAPSATFAAPPTGTPVPTATEAGALVILLVPPEAEQEQARQLQTQLSDLAAQSGMRFQIRPELSLEPGLTHVVVVPPYPGLEQLAAEQASVRFLAFGFVDLEPAENLFVIQGAGEKPDLQSFIAGYLAAAITPDWRVGVVLPLDSPEKAALQTGFENGVYYLCGLCRPVYPPFPLSGYPLAVELPLNSEPADWQSTLTFFSTWQVETVFVPADLASRGLLNSLAEAGIQLIGMEAAPGISESAWVASIESQDPISRLPDVWVKFIAGEPGEVIELPLVLRDINPELLSPGRQQFVEDMMVDLFAGYIGTGVEPGID